MTLDIRGMCPLLEVFDMRASIAFYCDVLGFEVAAHSDPREEVLYHWVLLKRAGIELMLNTAYDEGQRPGVPDVRRVAAHGDVTLYFGCPDVDAAYAYLGDKGVAKTAPKVAPYGMKQLYLKDPDGYGVCFQCPATEEEKQQAAGA
jgi:glyoxylase I family protein